ncbi:MAG TPA: hypothetical protein VGL46_12585 [Pseudonocardiaceae bacterium]|jgi:ribosomal protein L37E
MSESASTRACNRCGKVTEIKPRKAKCAKCIAELKRLDRDTNPDIKENEKDRYAKVKDDPEFKRANRDRVSKWKKMKKQQRSD